ncbi:MAG: septum formation initiator family protein [Candidatus Paceibacterota bacterium]
MREFQRKKRGASRVVYKIIIIILLLLLVVVIRATWGGYQKNVIARTSLNKTNQELQELEEQKNNLMAQVKWLASPRGQEEEIRKNFSVARPGEKVFIVIDETTAATSTNEEDTSGSWWQVITRFLKF